MNKLSGQQLRIAGYAKVDLQENNNIKSSVSSIRDDEKNQVTTQLPIRANSEAAAVCVKEEVKLEGTQSHSTSSTPEKVTKSEHSSPKGESPKNDQVIPPQNQQTEEEVKSEPVPVKVAADQKEADQRPRRSRAERTGFKKTDKNFKRGLRQKRVDRDKDENVPPQDSLTGANAGSSRPSQPINRRVRRPLSE
jgi:hypothetical protein